MIIGDEYLQLLCEIFYLMYLLDFCNSVKLLEMFESHKTNMLYV